MRIKKLLLAIATLTLVSATPVKHQFTAAEQQQISVPTPGLFSRSNAFNIDLDALKPNEYSFPLPVGKATLRKNNVVEITTKDGDAVKAMFDGTVRVSRKFPDMGYTIVIRHRNGLETVYANNAENVVEVGQHVRAGQTIAIVGQRGGKFYCDFSIMIDGKRINPTAVVGLGSHRLHRHTLLCEKQYNYINVSTIGEKVDFDDSKNFTTEDVFTKQSTYKWNLDEMKKGTWAYPLPGAKVISPYGGKRRHSGVDLKTKPKDEIVAAFDGVVTRSATHYGYGLCIVIKHANGLETLYSHQHKNLVKVGDKVKAGQVIGLTGRTGRATTEHLHFETIFKGRRFNPNLIFEHKSRGLQKATLTLTKNGGITQKRN